MAVDPKRVQAVFMAAVEHTEPAARAVLLNRECSGDEELRRRVEALLRANDEPGSYLEQPAVAPCMPTEAYSGIDERPGTMIGPYKLMEKIGEGGFGLVFVAEQTEPVKRKVALKVIKPGMDSKQVIARFEAERQALAMMDHPNIARVLDAGTTETGRLYFVMELVRGITITDYCDQNHLTPAERLELFISVCHAIQHAHQKGIIHRDIKPSNVLVTSHDGKPVAKVIDFGVAKAIHQHLTERTIYTNFAQMIGTPLYMSPEQAEMSGLDIDTRSDIYSLGVLLYELLTGTTPLNKKQFAQAAYDEIRRMIREDEPPKPSTRLSTSESIASIAAQRHTEPAKLSKLMRGDLDWITMKALEKDRTRRYETANGLARDIQRYLSDEPVEACPPSATYRLRKFAKKNRAALTTASVIALLLLGGIALSTWQAVRATRAEQLARQSAAEAVSAQQAETEQRLLAETNATRARAAAEAEKKSKEEAQAREAETKAVLEFVENRVFAAARPEGQDGGMGHDVRLADALRAALKHVETGFATQPLIEARLRKTLGTSFLALGDGTIAEEQYRRALQLFTANLGPDHNDTLKSMNSLAISYAKLDRKPEAMALFEETVKLQKAKLGADHPDTLTSISNLAICYTGFGRQAEALTLIAETLKLRKAKLGADHPDTLGSMHNLANCYTALGRHPEAIALREETFKLQKAKLGPNHPITLGNMNNLAMSYANLGQFPKALALYEETIKLQKAKLGPDHPDTLASMCNLAISYAVLGRHDEALKLREETLTLQKAKLGSDHVETLTSMHNLAGSYHDLGRHAEALKLFEETLALMKAKLGPDHPSTLLSMSCLARSFAALGRHAEALKLFEETLALRKSKLGPDDPETLASMSNLAISYAALGRHPEALALFEEALKLQKAKLGPNHPYTLASMNNLARSYIDLGRHSDALALYEETLKLQKATLGPDHPDTLMSMYNLARSHYTLKRYPQSLALHDETLKLRRAKLGPKHSDTLNSYWGVISSLIALKRHDEALPKIDEVLSLAAGAAAAGKTPDPRLIPQMYEFRIGIFRDKSDAAGCRATADMWEKLQRTDAEGLYNAACFRSICAEIMNKLKEAGANEQFDRAMAWLTKAVAAGYKDVAHMKKDIDLDALREREDFKKLLVELQAKAVKQ